MKRAALVMVDMGDESEVTLRVGVYFGPDSYEAAHSGAVADEVHFVEPSERLLADLRTLADAAETYVVKAEYGSWRQDVSAAVARVRAAIGDNDA